MGLGQNRVNCTQFGSTKTLTKFTHSVYVFAMFLMCCYLVCVVWVKFGGGIVFVLF